MGDSNLYQAALKNKTEQNKGKWKHINDEHYCIQAPHFYNEINKSRWTLSPRGV